LETVGVCNKFSGKDLLICGELLRSSEENKFKCGISTSSSSLSLVGEMEGRILVLETPLEKLKGTGELFGEMDKEVLEITLENGKGVL
jgi:hypothetical protein